MVSIKYSSDFFSGLSDSEIFFNEEIDYNSREEIKHPSLPMYIHYN